MLAVDPLLKILAGRLGNAILCLCKQIGALTKDDSAGGAGRGTSRLHVLLKPLLIAELTLDDLRIPRVPLKLRHLKGTCDLALPAPDAERTGPRHGSPIGLFQRAEWATGHAGWIETVHALSRSSLRD